MDPFIPVILALITALPLILRALPPVLREVREFYVATKAPKSRRSN